MLAVAITITLLAGCGTSGESTVNGGETAQVDTLTLVNEGVSDYVIVRGVDASASEVTASTELQSYLKQISGAELTIVTDDTSAVDKEIIVGKTNREKDGKFDRGDLGDEGFVIKTDSEKLYIVGGEVRGTLYGVYEFLESYLGCRFYTNTVEKVPEQKTITLDAITEDKQIPVFDYRCVYWYDMMKGDGYVGVKQKMNGYQWREIPDEMGGAVLFAGFFNTMDYMVPASQYWGSNPEYFAMDANGNRTTDQYCLSQPEVLNLTVATLKNNLMITPGATRVTLYPLDNDESCQCEACKAVTEEEGNFSGTWFRFVNSVAAELAEEFPDVKLYTLAYANTRMIPGKTVPAENVSVIYAPIEMCYSHPINECDVSTKDVGNPARSTNSAEKDLLDWLSISSEVYVWDYTTNFDHFVATFPDFGVLRQNILFYAENGVKGLFNQGNTASTSGEFGELRSYLLAKLMWNPYMTEEEYYTLMDDFLEGVYGEGLTYIREYIDLAQSLTKDTHFGIYAEPGDLYPLTKYDYTDEKALPEDLTLDMILNYENTDWTKYVDWYKGFTESEITSKGEELFAEAAALAADDAQLALINKAGLQVDYIKSYYLFMNMTTVVYNVRTLLKNYFEANDTGISAEEQEQLITNISRYVLSQARTAYAEYNETLYNNLLSFNITSIKEGQNLTEIETPNFQSLPEDWDD